MKTAPAAILFSLFTKTDLEKAIQILPQPLEYYKLFLLVQAKTFLQI